MSITLRLYGGVSGSRSPAIRSLCSRDLSRGAGRTRLAVVATPRRPQLAPGGSPRALGRMAATAYWHEPVFPGRRRLLLRGQWPVLFRLLPPLIFRPGQRRHVGGTGTRTRPPGAISPTRYLPVAAARAGFRPRSCAGCCSRTGRLSSRRVAKCGPIREDKRFSYH